MKIQTVMFVLLGMMFLFAGVTSAQQVTTDYDRSDAVQKFDALVAGRIDNSLSGEIKNAVRSVENIWVRDLMKLLGYVRQASSAVGSEPSGPATSTVTTTAD